MTLGNRTNTSLLERAADRTTDAVGTAVGVTQEFLENTAKPALHDAAVKTAPLVAAGAGMAAERATQAKEYAEAKSTQLTGHPKKKHRGRKLMLFALLGALAAGVAVMARRLTGSADEWMSTAPASTPEDPSETLYTDESVDDLTTPINKPPFGTN